VIPLPARAIVRFRFLVLTFWVVAAVLALPHATTVDEAVQVEGGVLSHSESDRATRLIQEAFPQPVSHFFVITIEAPVPIDSPRTRAMIEAVANAAAAESYINRVVSYLLTPDSSLVSADRRTTFLVAAARADSLHDPTQRVPAFRTAIHTAVESFPSGANFQVDVTGGPALDYDVRTVSTEDVRSGERKSLPTSAIILVLAFGALVAAVLPLVVGVFAITCALALVHVAAAFHPMSVFVLTIVSMVGLAVGIDYSLLIVTRFREELNRGRGARAAAARTISTAGRAVVTSGLTVAVGFASLLITPTTETRSVGIGGLFVVTAAVLLAVTFLPALLSYLGRAIDAPRWLARRLAWYHAPTAWERWARWLGRHPWRALILGAITIALITWPLAQIKIGLPRSNWFPANTESTDGVKALETMGARGTLQPVRLVLQAPEGQRIVGSRYIRALKRLSDSIHADPRVAQVRSVVDIQPGMSVLGYTMMYGNLDAARARVPEFYSAYLSEDARTTLMDVLLADTTSFTSSMDVARSIRTLVHTGAGGLDSVEVAVGGFAASSVDLQDELLGQFPLVIALVLISTAIMLFIAFGSILVPIKAVIMNCLSVAGAFGVMVLVFQHGVGGPLFGLDGPTEAVYVAVPVLVFAVVFGLSMDYEVFLLSRIKEAFDRSGRNDQATMQGLTATASVITSAAAIMIVVFGVFSFSRVLAAQQLGFGLAVAVFLDATLIRMVLVPAIMHIAGRWNWWPGVRRISESKEIEAVEAG
jgi:RND superfamily putative drug exporter